MSEEEFFNRAINRICKDYDYDFATEFKNLYMKKDKEISRLNNIINELEKWISKNLNDIYGYFENTPFGVENTYKEVLDKLQELKGSNKE